MRLFITWTGKKGDRSEDIKKEINDQWEEYMIPYFKGLIDRGKVISQDSVKWHEARFNNKIPELLKKVYDLKFTYYISYPSAMVEGDDKYANLPQLKWK